MVLQGKQDWFTEIVIDGDHGSGVTTLIRRLV
jgi:uridine kinase